MCVLYVCVSSRLRCVAPHQEKSLDDYEKEMAEKRKALNTANLTIAAARTVSPCPALSLPCICCVHFLHNFIMPTLLSTLIPLQNAS